MPWQGIFAGSWCLWSYTGIGCFKIRLILLSHGRVDAVLWFLDSSEKFLFQMVVRNKNPKPRDIQKLFIYVSWVCQHKHVYIILIPIFENVDIFWKEMHILFEDTIIYRVLNSILPDVWQVPEIILSFLLTHQLKSFYKHFHNGTRCSDH